MVNDVPIPNNWKDVRLAAGVVTPRDLAESAEVDPDVYEHVEAGRVLPTRDEFDRLTHVLGDVSAAHIYSLNYRQVLGVEPVDNADVAGWIREVMGAGRLFVAKHETKWLERTPPRGLEADVYLSMSCGFAAMPHLLLDAAAACDALGVNYVAVGGAAACCGKPLIGLGKVNEAERMAQTAVNRIMALGAHTRVSFCTACQVRNSVRTTRRAVVDGAQHHLRDVWLLDFLAERVRELGDKVPWQNEVRYRVLAEGHALYSPIHANAQRAIVRLLEQVPGVEVIGLYNGFAAESPCGGRAREEWMGTWQSPQTAEEIQQRRVVLADMAAARGADTISCQHQGCHEIWGRFASERLGVRHAVSILAEALGCAHPDRQQLASWLGDPREVVEQTRQNWESWGLSHDQALELARNVTEARYGAGVSQCSCGEGGGGCQEQLIGVDVLSGEVNYS